MQTDATLHYDQITDYMYWTNFIKNKGRIDPSFHKIIKVPTYWKSENPNELQSNYLYDMVLSIVSMPEKPVVLDAGCGFGGLIFWLCKKHPGTYHGITTSKVQINYARELAARIGLEKHTFFKKVSYDVPSDYRYDVIIAVESLLHSPNLSTTIKNLSSCLKVGGKLVIIEDMSFADENQTHLAGGNFLMEEWSISHFPTYNEYKKELGKNQLELIVDRDLSLQVQLIDKQLLQVIKNVCKLASFLPVKLIRKIARFHLAQMILHEMYHDQIVQYRILVAEKNFGG